MSDEIKNTTAPEAQSEQTAADEAQAAPKGETKAKGKTDAKGKSETKARAGQAEKPSNALKSVGLDACKRHGIAEVWVTADGLSFPQSGDAKAHAANLNDKQILNVKAE